MSLIRNNVPCPKCGFYSPQTVVSTRRVEEGVVVRRRHCKECDNRFYTSQEAEQPVSPFIASQLTLRHSRQNLEAC